MSDTKYLSAQITVLVAQYGERAMLETLAPILGSPVNELEALLSDVRKAGHAQFKKANPRKIAVSVTALLHEHPDKAAVILNLQSRFDNRTLMPELKDVKRFLERRGKLTASIKNRADAFPVVAAELVRLPLAELEEMLQPIPEGGFSSLGIISDQILGKK